MDICENLLHEVFMDKRINPKREFFSVSPEQVVAAIKLAEIVNITPVIDIVDTPEEQKALDEARKKRNKINLKLLNILEGSILRFVDDYTIICTVVNNSKVLYENYETSLSDAAVKAYAKL